MFNNGWFCCVRIGKEYQLVKIYTGISVCRGGGGGGFISATTYFYATILYYVLVFN